LGLILRRALLIVSLVFLFSIAVVPTGLRASPGVHISVTNSPVNVGQPIHIEYYMDPGENAAEAALYITTPAGGADIWDSAPTGAITGGLLYDVTAPGLTTAGTYIAGIRVWPVYPGPSTTTESTFQVIGGASPFDFSLSLSPSSLTVKQGETTSYQILISYSDPSYSGTSITVQVTGLGPGMNYQLTPSPPAVRISTSQSTPTGSYTITITGSAQGVTHQTSATLVVQPGITNYTVDWTLSNPSLSPPSPSVGDLTTFNVVITQISSDWTGPLSVSLSVNLDGSPFDYLWVYQDQVIPPGITKSVSTKPWTATAGAHLVTWKLTFFGGDETVIIQDPTANNEASLQITVSAATSTIQTVTQVQTTTETMAKTTPVETIVRTVTQSSTKGAVTFTVGDSDLIIVGLIVAIVILIGVIALRRHRHGPYAPPPPPAVRSTAVTTGFCVNCGAPLKPHVKFCESCGERIE